MGSDAYGFRFTDGRRDVIAVCAPDSGRLLSYRSADRRSMAQAGDAETRSEGIRVVNAFGEQIVPMRLEDADIITLDAGFPIYLSGPVGFNFETAAVPVTYSIERAAARAGQTVTLRLGIAPPQEVIGWDMPPGWDLPYPAGEGVWKTVVPQRVADYEWSIQAFVATPGVGSHVSPALSSPGELRVPLRLSVTPAVIRI